jgi:hypothetical protein
MANSIVPPGQGPAAQEPGTVAYLGRDGVTVRCGRQLNDGTRVCPHGVLGHIEEKPYGRVLRFPDGWTLKGDIWQQGREKPRRPTNGQWLTPPEYPALAQCPTCGTVQRLDASALRVVLRRGDLEPDSAIPAVFLIRPPEVSGRKFPRMPEVPGDKHECADLARQMAAWYPDEAEWWERLADWFETASKRNRDQVYGRWYRSANGSPEQQGRFARDWWISR